MARPRVVILGAGFGGLVCAKKLESSQVDVLLVDRHNYHLFTPLLYQVASSLLNPSDIAYPIRKVFRGSANVRFRQADITAIELEHDQLASADGEVIPYDLLVIATGSATHYFGNLAVERHSFGLKTLGEALQLRNHILYCLEEASAEPDGDRQREWMTFVIAGGGPTGVEYAGALAELMRLVVQKEYPTIAAEPRIVLVEGGKRLLGAFAAKLSDYTKRRLERLGVEVRLETLLASAGSNEVVLKGGERLRCRTLVWSAGVRAIEPPADQALAHTRSRRLEVDGYLRVAGRRNVYAIGDVAAVRDDGGELPMMSPPAMQQGRYVAELILAGSGSRAAEPNAAPFRYADKGIMATIGRNAAVCRLPGGLKLTGFLGWIFWLLIHIYYLIGFRNRWVVLWSWFWNYVWYDRPVRIITRARAEPQQGGS